MQIPWEDFVYYDTSSPTCLRWKISRGNHCTVDSVAGSINKGRCSFVFSYKGTKKRRYTHRVIWELFNGCIDDASKQIDHIDGNPLNNRIDNLRLVSRSVNMRNTRQNSRNTSGIAGVSVSYINGYKYWTVSFVNGEGAHKLKHFSCHKHGDEAAKNLAVSYRKQQLLLSGEYTDRHGQPGIQSLARPFCELQGGV